MTTSVYPGAYDTDANLGRVSSSTGVTPPDHNNLNDAIQAIEGTLGLNPQGTYSTVVERLDSIPSGGDIEWTAPTLLNSWANHGSGEGVAGFLVDGVGVVHLRGAIDSGSSGTVAFVLPSGYRPAQSSWFSIWAGCAGGYAVGVCNVLPSGDVVPYWNLSGLIFTSLDGVSFSTVS